MAASRGARAAQREGLEGAVVEGAGLAVDQHRLAKARAVAVAGVEELARQRVHLRRTARTGSSISTTRRRASRSSSSSTATTSPTGRSTRSRSSSRRPTGCRRTRCSASRTCSSSSSRTTARAASRSPGTRGRSIGSRSRRSTRRSGGRCRARTHLHGHEVGRRGGVHPNLDGFAKIEDQLAVRNLDSIIAVSDAIMVARGDLGIECPMEAGAV